MLLTRIATRAYAHELCVFNKGGHLKIMRGENIDHTLLIIIFYIFF